MAELTLYTISVGGGCDHISKISSATKLPPHAGLAGPPQLTESHDQDLKTQQEVALLLWPFTFSDKFVKKDKEEEGDGRKTHTVLLLLLQKLLFLICLFCNFSSVT